MWSILSRVLITRDTLSVLDLIATHNSVQYMDTPRVNSSLPQKRITLGVEYLKAILEH